MENAIAVIAVRTNNTAAIYVNMAALSKALIPNRRKPMPRNAKINPQK